MTTTADRTDSSRATPEADVAPVHILWMNGASAATGTR